MNYCCIFTKDRILFNTKSIIFSKIIKYFQEIFFDHDTKKNYQNNEFRTQLIIKNKIAFLCCTSLDFPVKTSFKFLKELSDNITYDMNEILDLMNYYTNHGNENQIKREEYLIEIANVEEKLLSKRSERIEIFEDIKTYSCIISIILAIICLVGFIFFVLYKWNY